MPKTPEWVPKSERVPKSEWVPAKGKGKGKKGEKRKSEATSYKSEATCYKCYGVGHFAYECPGKGKRLKQWN